MLGSSKRARRWSGEGRGRGIILSKGASGGITPAIWDVEDTYGFLAGEARTYLSAQGPRMRPTLALRVGRKKLFGHVPFEDLAYIGGRSTLRGWSTERFAGDASLYASTELRLFLHRFRLMLPGDFGILGVWWTAEECS